MSAFLIASRRFLPALIPSRQVFCPTISQQRFGFSSETERPMKNLSDKFVEGLRRFFFEKSRSAERYRYCARRADVAGQIRASVCFNKLAEEESKHAHSLLSAIERFTGADPFTSEKFGSTKLNLDVSLISEMHNVERSFPEFLAAPKASKVERVDKLFDSISNADLHHVSAVQNEIDDLREQLSNKNKGATAPDADPR